MVVRCPACAAAYKMDAARIPATGIRVRCPRCSHIFQVRHEAVATAPAVEALAGIERDDRTPPRFRPEAPTARRPLEKPESPLPPRSAWTQERTLDLEPSTAAKPATPPRLETAPFRPSESGIPTTITPPPPATASQSDRPRRLARVLVSDILVYNQAARDRALGEGNLPVALAAEITKAWDLYKSKVGAETANGTTYFKDALNEILADGTKVF